MTPPRASIEEVPGSADLAADLPAAFGNHDFRFHYQTKVRLSDEGHVGFEALARWIHPRLGLIYPGTFVPLVERLGHIEELTRLLLGEAAADLAGWRAEGLHPGSIAINLPAAILATRLGINEVEDAIEGHGFPWSSLTLDISEPIFRDPSLPLIQAHLIELSRRGAHVALDDFGTGHASIEQLQSFPIDEIKIDKSYIGRIGVDAKGERIVAAMIAMGRGLGKTMLAEGVETREQRLFLIEEGCQLAQGYLFGPPEPAEIAAQRLLRRDGNAARRAQITLVDAAGAA
jgi:EAL domain-containing protein (putative c-di-GMP-specific phosphodiesterase class I)